MSRKAKRYAVAIREGLRNVGVRLAPESVLFIQNKIDEALADERAEENGLSLIQKANLSYWFPKIRESGAPTPVTMWSDGWNQEALLKILDGEFGTLYRGLEEWINRAAMQIALRTEKRKTAYPVFVRTGHTSGKHEWNRTCNLIAKEGIKQSIFGLVEYSVMADPVEMLPIDTWVVREMLSIQPAFIAFGGLPIARERRYFVRDGRVLKHMPYWPEEAILATVGTTEPPSDEDWRELLKEFNFESEMEQEFLGEWSAEISLHLDGAWSVDWILDSKRGWVCIDCAPAELSWGWEERPPVVING